jgi:hypothetical protein
MPGTELLEQSAPRAELDQRSREARLRLEQVERLLVMYLWRRQSLLRRVVHCFRAWLYVSGQAEGRLGEAVPTAAQSGQTSEAPSETGGAADCSPVAPPSAWPSCTNRVRLTLVQSDFPVLKPWQPWCGRIS